MNYEKYKEFEKNVEKGCFLVPVVKGSEEKSINTLKAHGYTAKISDWGVHVVCCSDTGRLYETNMSQLITNADYYNAIEILEYSKVAGDYLDMIEKEPQGECILRELHRCIEIEIIKKQI